MQKRFKASRVRVMHFLIHVADPQSRPVVIIVFTHVVRPHFSIQNKFQAKTIFATGETVGLAEWIIDDPCLVFFAFLHFFLVFPFGMYAFDCQLWTSLPPF